MTFDEVTTPVLTDPPISRPSPTTTDFYTALYFRDGSSDKSYVVQVVRSGDGYAVQFAYGRRGSTLTTGCKTAAPVPIDKAISIAAKLVAEKKAKGYTEDASGTRFVGTADANAVAPYLPQLLNAVDETKAEALLDDPRIACQEKMDGRRLILVKDAGGVRGVNRRGLFVGVPVHWGQGSLPSCVIDGEGIGDTLHAFDLLEVNGTSYREEPFRVRYEALERLLQLHRPQGIERVPATCVPSEKRTLLEWLRRENREGLVFKDIDAPYTAGRPASGGAQRKFKFQESATFIVGSVSGTKRSVALEAFDAGGLAVNVGNVTIPANHAVPEVGALVEVRFLYRFATGSLFQPVYLGVRDDIETSAATLSQIRRVKHSAPDGDED